MGKKEKTTTAGFGFGLGLLLWVLDEAKVNIPPPLLFVLGAAAILMMLYGLPSVLHEAKAWLKAADRLSTIKDNRIKITIIGAIFGALLVGGVVLSVQSLRSDAPNTPNSIAYVIEPHVVPNWPPDAPDAVGLQINLKNKNSSQTLKYQVRSLSVAIDGYINIPPPTLDNNGGIIYDQSTFTLPALIFGIDPGVTHDAIMNFVIDYGFPTGLATRRPEADVKLIFNKGSGYEYYWIGASPRESPISIPFSGDTPTWQSNLATSKSQP